MARGNLGGADIPTEETYHAEAPSRPDHGNEYAFFRSGGWSWSIPYIAGVYALACQVEPKITPERFWELALKTGRTIRLKHEGEDVPFGPIIDPPALIEAIGRASSAK